MLTHDDLQSIYELFVYGIPVGALVSLVFWFLGYGIGVGLSWFKHA